jgi:hypothetical protein
MHGKPLGVIEPRIGERSVEEDGGVVVAKQHPRPIVHARDADASAARVSTR